MSNQALLSDRTYQFIVATSVRLSVFLLGASLFASFIAAAELPWLNDLEKAKQVAAEQHKDLFINFTGTSWCQSCVELEREVLLTDEFAPAADTFVLVRLEYPGGVPRLPQEPAAPRPTWLEQYGVLSYPTVFLADAKGTPYATTGHIGLKPADFVKHLLELQRTHPLRDAAFADAAKSEGASKLKALDAGLKSLLAAFADTADYSNADPLLKFYSAEINEVIGLDPNNDAGIRDRWKAVAEREQDAVAKKAFAKQLSEAYAKDGVDAALQLLAEAQKSNISEKRKKELCWTRLTCLEKADRHTDAIAYAEELIGDRRFNPQEQVRLRQRVAVNLNWMGRTEESLAAYDQAIAQVEKVEPDRKGRILSDKANVYWYAKRYQEALEVHSAVIKHLEPNTVEWGNEQAWQIRLLARLGRAEDAWKAYDEFAKSTVTAPQERLDWMAFIAKMPDQADASEAARDAAIRTKEAIASLQDPTVDPAEAQKIVNEILAPSTQSAPSSDASEATK